MNNIPKDTMHTLYDAFGPRCFNPYGHGVDTLESLHKTRGMHEVLTFVLEMYEACHGEPYVPRSEESAGAAADPEAAAPASAFSGTSQPASPHRG